MPSIRLLRAVTVAEWAEQSRVLPEALNVKGRPKSIIMQKQRSDRSIPVRTLLLLCCFVTAVILLFLLFGETVDEWTGMQIERAQSHRLFTGVFLALLLTVDVVIPVPSSVVSTACGMLLGFFGGMLASFAGMTGTVAAGYLIGRYAAAPAERLIGERETLFLRSFYRRHGNWLLLAMRPVPVLAEASVMFSGISRKPLLPVFAVTAIGNAGVSLVYVMVGVWGREAGAFFAAFGISIALSVVLMLVMRWRGMKPA